jgi:hypothetical protein
MPKQGPKRDMSGTILRHEATSARCYPDWRPDLPTSIIRE